MRKSTVVALLALVACRDGVAPEDLGRLLEPIPLAPSVQASGFLRNDSAFVQFVNTSSTPDSMFYGACSFLARVYAVQSDVPSWQNLDFALPCISIAYQVVVPAQGTAAVRVADLTSAPSGQVVIYFNTRQGLHSYLTGTHVSTP